MRSAGWPRTRFALSPGQSRWPDPGRAIARKVAAHGYHQYFCVDHLTKIETPLEALAGKLLQRAGIDEPLIPPAVAPKATGRTGAAR